MCGATMVMEYPVTRTSHRSRQGVFSHRGLRKARSSDTVITGLGGPAGIAGEQRDMALIRRLIERVRACALRRPMLFCTDGVCSYIRAIRETFREPMHTGGLGRPRLRPWRNICIAQLAVRRI